MKFENGRATCALASTTIEGLSTVKVTEQHCLLV